MKLLSLLLLVPFASCHFMGGQHVAGDGHITSQDKQVGRFTKVNVSGDVSVHVRPSDTPGVRIETDGNLMQYVDVYTEGNTVTIRTKDGYDLDPSHELVAYVSAPVFEEIGVSGSCDILGDAPLSGNGPLSLHVSGDGDIKMEVNFPSVATGISGSGSVELKGHATTFSADVSGEGKVKCLDLDTDNSKLDLSGSADVELSVNKQLDVSVSGSADVRYRGNATVKQNISGSGSVKKI